VSGTLELSNELCWMPAGWVYDNVLDRLAAELEAEHPAIARTLLQARSAENGGYLDLRSARADELLALRQAAEKVHARLESEGASSFAAPEFYDGFVSQFRAFREILGNRLRELSVVV
jgi:hypothetical protein